MLGFRRHHDATQVIETASLDEVPPRCVTLDDYYAHPARLTMQRVLRGLTAMADTPAFEFVHNFRLVPALATPAVRDAAIRTVALAQARAYQEDAATLTQILINRLGEMQRHTGASYALDRFYKAYLDGDSSALYQAIDLDPAVGANRVLSYVAARIVRDKTNWREKASTLVHQVEDSSDRRFARAIDELVAELFDTPILLRPLTGHAPETVAAMEWLVLLALGLLEDRHLPRGLSISLLRGLGRNDFPATRAVLLTKAAEGLRAVSLAAAARTRKERTSLERMVQVLCKTGRFLGTGALASALVYRMQGLLPDGLELGSLEDQRRHTGAVKEILGLVPSRAAQASFLQTLLQAQPAPTHAEPLRSLLQSNYADLVTEPRSPHGPALASPTGSEWSLGDIASLGYAAPSAGEFPSDRLDFAPEPAPEPPGDAGMTQELTITTGGGKVLLLSFQGRTTLLNTQGQSLLIGRDRRCDLRLDNPSVSRQHASLTLDDQGFALIDQSRNGTLVKIGDDNPVRVRQNRFPLEGHGVIVAGETPANRDAWEQASIKFSVMSFDAL